jgi:hypothetical protein
MSIHGTLKKDILNSLVEAVEKQKGFNTVRVYVLVVH